VKELKVTKIAIGTAEMPRERERPSPDGFNDGDNDEKIRLDNAT